MAFYFEPTPRPNFKIYPAVADAIIKIGEKLKAGCSAAEAAKGMDDLISYALGQSIDQARAAIKAAEGAPLTCTSSRIVEGRRVETYGPAGHNGLLHARKQAHADHLVALEEAITHTNYSHARDREGFVTIYHRDSSSPSGVMATVSGSAKEVNPLLRALRNNSPLSPTEGLYSPSRG